jgi:hypothetical protein
MWNKKSKPEERAESAGQTLNKKTRGALRCKGAPREPKKKKLEARRHSWPSKIRLPLK